MKRKLTRILACLLSACLLSALAACGSSPEEAEGAQMLSGTVYVPDFLDCALPLLDVSASCTDGDAFYLAGQVETDEADDTGGYAVSSSSDSSATFLSGAHPALFRADGETGEVAALTDYVPTALPENSQGDVSITALSVGAEGTLWALERITVYQSLDSGSIGWDAFANDIRQIWRHLDSGGAELGRVDVDELARELAVDGFDGLAADSAGRLYAAGGGVVSVLDSEGNLLGSLAGAGLTGQLLPLNGSIGAVAIDDQGSRLLRLIDSEAQAWGAEYPLPADIGSIFPGDDGRFYYDNRDSLYACRWDGEQGEKLLDWSAAGVDQTKRIALQTLSNGKLAALLRKGDSWPQTYELALLTPTDASQVAEKTVLRLATLGLDYRIQAQVAGFNKHSDRYRIEITDYSQFNTDDDVTAGLTRLNTEIIAGNIPDILDTVSLPLRQYAAKGLLEDLWPYIEEDPELGREGVMERALQAAEIGGRLCQVFGDFSIQTVVGAAKVVGGDMGWTLEELRQALASMPEGCKIFGQYETKGTVLDAVLSQELGRYVNWPEGTCAFDSEAFRSLLEFCNSFPSNVDPDEAYVDEMAALSQGQQLLIAAQLSDFSSIQMYKTVFGGEVTFIGYPTGEGCGSAFVPGAGLALSAACDDKEGAWSFIRTVLLPEEETYLGGFPTNRAAFQQLTEESMEVTYAQDEKGELLLDGKGNPIENLRGAWYWEGGMAEIYATTQAEYDQMMALYGAVDTVAERDESILRIVRENAAAYFSGDKTAENAVRDIQSRVKLYINEQR